MQVLDLFCGRGGWSKPFIEDGDEVWGIDIKDYGYPGNLIKEDIRNLDGYGFSDMDLIIGSPPCSEFTTARGWRKNYPAWRQPNPEEGVKLIQHFYRFVKEAQPDFWAMENLERTKLWWKEPPIWKFKISVGGRRLLWGNFNLPLSPEFKINRWMGLERAQRIKHGRLSAQDRAMIPYPIARFVADSVKGVARK